MPDNSIGAYFQCYKNPFATYSTLLSFRQQYPTSTIVLVSDNGYDYTAMANYFKCYYIHETENSPLIKYPLKDANFYNNMTTFIKRIINAFSLCQEEYIMWLEDDVSVNQKIPTAAAAAALKYDLNGFCPNHIQPYQLIELKKTYDFLNLAKTYPFTGHGGSIFKRETVLRMLSNTPIINDVLFNLKNYRITDMNELAQDYFFSLIITLNGGSIGNYEGHRDSSDYDPSIAVQHQYKKWYGAPMPGQLKHLVKM